MNERSIMRTWVLVVLLIVTVASVAHAGPVNCAVTPSNPACAPSLKVTYHASGGGPTTVVRGEHRSLATEFGQFHSSLRVAQTCSPGVWRYRL